MRRNGLAVPVEEQVNDGNRQPYDGAVANADAQGVKKRPASSLARDAAILDAALEVLANEGWSEFQFKRVADQAGVSVQALRTRFVDRLGLASAVWTQRCYPYLSGKLAHLAEVGHHSDSVDAKSLQAALIPFMASTPELLCAVELIIVAQYERVLNDAIEATLTPFLAEYLTPRKISPNRADAARVGYVFALAFGLVTQSRRSGAAEIVFSTEVQRLATALNAQMTPAKLPSRVARHLDAAAVFGTGDAAWDALLQSAFDHVGELGFDRTTVASVTQRTGYSEGLLFYRYPSKRDLFYDASKRMAASSMELNLEFQQQIATTHSQGIAEAVMIREFMRPGREKTRVVFLEQSRLAWHDEELRTELEEQTRETIESQIATYGRKRRQEALAEAHAALAMATGIVVLACVAPQAWTLPFDVVTIPMAEQ